MAVEERERERNGIREITGLLFMGYRHYVETTRTKWTTYIEHVSLCTAHGSEIKLVLYSIRLMFDISRVIGAVTYYHFDASRLQFGARAHAYIKLADTFTIPYQRSGVFCARSGSRDIQRYSRKGERKREQGTDARSFTQSSSRQNVFQGLFFLTFHFAPPTTTTSQCNRASSNSVERVSYY